VTAEPLSNEELAGLRRACRKGVTAPDNRLAALTYREARGLLATIDARDAEIERLHGAMAPFAASAVKHGDATINDVRAAIGLPAWVPAWPATRPAARPVARRSSATGTR